MVLAIIDAKDRSILKELNLNSRQSYNSIAKKTRLSKNQVVYRINRLLEIGIIRKFCAVINYPKLGYHYYRYFFKIEFMSEDVRKKMIGFIKEMENIYWVATAEGKYNLIIESIHKKVAHAIEQYLLFECEFSENISDKELSLVAYGYNLPNNYIYTEFVSEVNAVGELHDNEQRFKPDEKESKIINIIKEDSRVNAIDLAKKTKLSSKTIIAKLRQFEKEKIILKYRVTLNHNKFEFEQYHVFLKLDFQGKKEIEDRVCEMLKNEKSIIRIIKPVGYYDLEFRCLQKNNYNLIELLEKIKKEFPKIVRSHEFIIITEVFPINTLTY